jgi:hypothetical protein
MYVELPEADICRDRNFQSLCLMQGYITLPITKIGRDIRSPRLGRLIPFEVD